MERANCTLEPGHSSDPISGFLLVALAILAALGLTIPFAAAGEAVGGPSAVNGWSTRSAVSVIASSSHIARPVIRAIDGSGIDSSGSLHRGSAADGDPGPYMWLSGPYAGPKTRPGTVTGSHWIMFIFNRAYDLGHMWIWNYNEMPNNWTMQGMKEVTIQYSVTGSTNPSDWSTIYDGVIPKTSEWLPEASPWNTPVARIVDFAGARAQFVIIVADDGPERNWAGGGPGSLEAGLSEVRFFTYTTPSFSIVDVNDRTGLTFQSLMGSVYRPESAPTATPTDWSEMGYTLIGDGSQMFAFDPAGYSTQRTYRIVRE